MKFNQVSKGKNLVINYEGAPAYRLSPEWDLYTSVVTSMMSDKFYETASCRLERLRNLIQSTDPHFVARLAIYARERMNLRSVPLVLAVELAKVHSGDSLIQKMTERVIQRADEITELLSYYQMANERKDKKKLNRLSKQLQAGLQHAFNNFDEYQFAKYNRDTEIKFRDALFLVHPKAKNDEQQLIFNKIVENKLQPPYTWETELSSLGQNKYESYAAKKEAFTQKWEELIDSEKVGYMALLRNLRNILEANVSAQHIQRVCEIISDKGKVLKSKQLPFRFLSAYREVSTNAEYAAYKIKMEEKKRRIEVEAENMKMEMKPLEDAVKVVTNNITNFNVFLEGYKRLGQKILEEEISTPHNIRHACKIICKKQEELHTQQLPLLFLEAYEELSKINSSLTSQVMNVLEDAVMTATKNIAEVNKFLSEITVNRELLTEEAYKELHEEIAAYKEPLPINPNYITLVLNALEDAVKVAAGNIAGFDETTKVLIACDVSASMQKTISPKSKIMNYDIGLMLGMLLKSRCKNAVSGIFGDTWKIVELPDSGILSNVGEFYKREGEVGYSTNGYLVIEDLINREIVMDKIMIFTDCQMWNSTGSDTQMKDVWKKYKAIAPEAKLYLFDLAGYGQVPLDITNDNVHLIAGWSDKIFDILQAIENGSDALKEIKAIEI